MIIIIIQLICIFLFPFISKKHLKIYFFIVALILATIAFFFQPSADMDLYKHYQTIDYFKIHGWDYVKTTYIFKTLPIYGVYFYLISLLPVKEFLPAVTVFITYFLSFNLIYKISRDNNIKKSYIMITFSFFILGTDYLSVISGIRNMLAFSIFVYFLYIDLVEKKHKLLCFLIYIALCALHDSVIILVLFRIIVCIYNRFTRITLMLALVFWTFFLDSILNIVNLFTGSYFIKITEKVGFYYIGILDYNLRTVLFELLCLILLTLIFISYHQENRNKNYYPSKYWHYIFITIAFTLGSIKQYELFLRMTGFIMYASPYYIMMFLDSNSTKNKTKELINIREKKLITNKYKMFLTVLIIQWAIFEIVFRLSVYKYLIFKF